MEINYYYGTDKVVDGGKFNNVEIKMNCEEFASLQESLRHVPMVRMTDVGESVMVGHTDLED